MSGDQGSPSSKGGPPASPNRLPWPPMIYIAASILAVAANHIWPLRPELDLAVLRLLGAVLLQRASASMSGP